MLSVNAVVTKLLTIQRMPNICADSQGMSVFAVNAG